MKQERQWIKRIRRGDGEALRAVYLAYKDDLLTVAGYILGDKPAAEDVVHDVFVRFAAGVRVRGSLRKYLTVSVSNRAKDYYRSRMRRDRLHPATLDDAPPAEAADSQPIVELIEREDARLAMGALGQLPIDQREVIALRIHGSMTFRQIAKAQGVSGNTVRSRYRYGIEKLRTLLRTGGQA